MMNRFEYVLARLSDDESFVAKDKNIKIYDGDEKTNFEDGEIVLTTHRLFWGRSGEIARGQTTLCLNLKYIQSLNEETASSFVFGKKKRIIVHLKSPEHDKAPGPVEVSAYSFIKLSGRNGLDPGFVVSLTETILARIWETNESIVGNDSMLTDTNNPLPRIKLRTGIVGIERGLQERQKQTDENINLAFQDLNKLMSMAKDMVSISKVISAKIRERHGEISEDETVRFKSYLLSLGIDDPVTRGSFESSSLYYENLAKQVCEMLLDPLSETGGMMSLADVYCRINRARGLELLSPEDLLNACRHLHDGPIKLRQFPSGAMVLQLQSHDDEAVARETSKQVEQTKSLSSEELARLVNISIVLAQERLLTAERVGGICRDESIEGLRFYPNFFLNILIDE